MNRSTSKSPFEIVYGHIILYFLDSSSIPYTWRQSANADNLIEHIKVVHQEVSEKLTITATRYKEVVVQHWWEHEFNVGDLVTVYFCTERFLAGSNNKLSQQKFGPYRILKGLEPNT